MRVLKQNERYQSVTASRWQKSTASQKNIGRKKRRNLGFFLAPALLLGAGYVWVKSNVYSSSPAVSQKIGEFSASSGLSKAEGNVHVLRELLQQHVRTLTDFFPRSWNHPEKLDQTANYLRHALTALGYDVQEQSYQVTENLSQQLFPMKTFDRSFGVLKPITLTQGPKIGTTYRNLWVEIAAKDDSPFARTEPIVVGAHYDAIEISPGADDNASGVAGVLELARLFKENPPRVPLVLALWTNEEYPFGTTVLSGSMQHAMALRKAKTRIRGVFSLEMIGTFSEEPGTQHFPFPINILKHQFDRGNFLTIFTSYPNRKFAELLEGNLQGVMALPLHTAAAWGNTGWDNDLLRSDHWSFIQQGYAGAAIGDSATYRQPALHQTSTYHTPNDTPDTLNYPAMTFAVEGMYQMFRNWREK